MRRTLARAAGCGLLHRRPSQGGSPLPSALALAWLLLVTSRPVAAPPVHPPAARCCKATIRVRVPDGTGTVYLTGSLPQLGPWRPDGLAMAGEGRERAAQVSAPPSTTLEYKFTLGSCRKRGCQSVSGQR